MAYGLVPGRGHWAMRTLTIQSASTFSKGCALAINGGAGKGFQVSEYSGGAPNFFGIATHDSFDSLPKGIVTIAVPQDYNCTVFADLDVVTASGLSVGFSGGIIKKGNLTSYFSSAISTVAAGRPLIVYALPNSVTSQVECTIATAALLSATSNIPV